MSSPAQKVLDFLSDPSTYPQRPAEVKLLQTHASWVFIASPFVFKIKKPVRLGFLDFSTLELRREDCERELALNRRLAEDTYLGVTSVNERDGTLSLGGEGEPIEWVVQMRELDAQHLLIHLLERDALCEGDFDRVISKLEHFYLSQPRPPESEQHTAIERLHLSTDGNFTVAADFVGRSLSRAAFDAIRHYTDTFFERRRALLQSRIDGGWIRDCHGDLHLEHIHVTPDAVAIYDCIEFNTRFRYIDLACDLAFLAMDLEFNGRADLASRLVTQFAARLHDDGMKELMDFYKCYRACVRGKVASLTSAAEGLTAEERDRKLSLARRYFTLALRYALSGSRPQAFICMGRIASGKSHLARALARDTGWVVFSSDVIRKELAGVPAHHRGNEAERAALYAPSVTERTYATLFARALEALRNGQPVILDATFSSRAHRDELRRSLTEAQVAQTWIVAHASDEVTRQRLASRAEASHVVSDARLEDFEKLSAGFQLPEEIPAPDILHLSTNSDAAASALLLHLAERGVARARV